MLRRLKTDVELSLPPKKEILVYAPLTSVQEKYYTSIINKTIYQVVQKEEKIVSQGTSTDGDNVLHENNGTVRQSSRVSKQR